MSSADLVAPHEPAAAEDPRAAVRALVVGCGNLLRGDDAAGPVLVDACLSGSEPGTLFRLPGEACEQLPPLAGLNLHCFRWDHALAFARWLLKDEYPARISVFLVEAAALELGAPLSEPVSAALERLADLLLAELAAESGGADG